MERNPGRPDPPADHAGGGVPSEPEPGVAPAAPQIIVEVYRQRSDLVAAGATPDRVVLSPEDYRLLQEYRAALGSVPEGKADYIDRYRLFDLEICIENVPQPVVLPGETRPPGG